MSTSARPEALLARLDDALALLAKATDGQTAPEAEAAPLPSLLDACEAAVAAAPAPVLLRSLHHFACTGGTLLSKCLSVMPNVVLLSELDPLSNLRMPNPQAPRPSFMPSDLIYAGRVALRPISQDTAIAIFQAGLARMIEEAQANGTYLVLRDHAHSQFCTDQAHEARPTVHDILTQLVAVRSVITVRHPLDSFLSLHQNGWVHFSPPTFETYCLRYLAFLARHPGLEIVKYEDFVSAPETELARLCRHLALPFRPEFETLIEAAQISGDSGRRGGAIAPRPRRAVPEGFAAQLTEAPSYPPLCARLGYEVVTA